MGGKSKRFLKEEVVPIIFSFVPETTRKHQEPPIGLPEESSKKLLMEETYYCFISRRKTKTKSARTRGTLLAVTIKCHNKHIRTWQTQPMVNNIGVVNILLSGAILYTGKTFKII